MGRVPLLGRETFYWDADTLFIALFGPPNYILSLKGGRHLPNVENLSSKIVHGLSLLKALQASSKFNCDSFNHRSKLISLKDWPNLHFCYLGFILGS